MKTAKDIEDICKKLKPVLGEMADRLWYMYLAEDEKGRRNIAMDIDIIAEKVLKVDPLSKRKVLLTPPTRFDASGSYLVGNSIYNNKKICPVHLRSEDFAKQVGIFSVTGEGKTNLAYLLALQLLKQKVPFLVIDWKRSWRNLLSLKDEIPELKDVHIFTVGRDTLPFLWNPVRPPPGSDRELWIGTVSDALERSHISGPGVAYFINKIFLKYMKKYDDGFYPNFFDGIKDTGNIRAFERELRWKQTAMRIFQSFTVGGAAKVFNTRSPIRLEKLLDKPVILELDLEMPKHLRIFITEVILRWIHLYRMGQGESESLRHVLFLEEAHNLFTDNGMSREVNSIENVFREIRAFGQGIVSITQHPSLLPVYLLGNCHTQIYLGLQHADDILSASRSLFLERHEQEYLNLLRVGECIVKVKNRIDPCLVKVPLVSVSKGMVTDKWLKANAMGYLPTLFKGTTSKAEGYLPPEEYSSDIKGKTRQTAIGEGFKLLENIYLEPFSGIARRYRKLNLNPKYGNKYKNHLVSEGFIRPRKILTPKGWILLFDISEKGKAVLRDMGHDVPNVKEGIVHKFWKFKIAEYYKKAGFEVLVEEKVNGRPDIIVLKGDKRVAVEIETGYSEPAENVLKRLKEGFDEITCVATAGRVVNKIRQDLKDKGVFDKRVRITTVFSFDID